MPIPKRFDKDSELHKKSCECPISILRLVGYVTNYYSGALVLKKGILSMLFKYDFENEVIYDQLLYLEKFCSDVFNETALDNDFIITSERDEFDKLTKYVVSSKNICDYISSIDQKILNGKDDIESLFYKLEKSSPETYQIALLQRFEFIVGSYLYHQTENEGEWRFANNCKKVKLITDFLYALADEDDVIETTSYFRTPHVHYIKLNKDGPLWNEIKSHILSLS